MDYHDEQFKALTDTNISPDPQIGNVGQHQQPLPITEAKVNLSGLQWADHIIHTPDT